MTDHDPDAVSSAPTQSADTAPAAADAARADQGPGCMPAILAAAALSGIAFFICCGVSTWFLYQQRTSLAVQTLRQSYVPEIQQSLLPPESKVDLLSEVNLLIDKMERGQVENWQSAAIMQRLQRLPVLQWGDLQATEAFINSNGDAEQRQQAAMQFHRVRLGVKQGKLTSFDFATLLEPVQVVDSEAASGKRLADSLTLSAAMKTVESAKTLAGREKIETIEPASITPIPITSIVEAEIKAALSEGGY